MIFYLLMLFTLVPLVELAILIWIGIETSAWVPVLMVLATGIAGTALARWQGWRAVARIGDELRQGRVPADALLDGVLILIAGLLLITPGVLTDLIGFSLLLPPLRGAIKRRLAAWLRRSVEIPAAHMGVWGSGAARAATSRDEIIDAQVIETRVEDAR